MPDGADAGGGWPGHVPPLLRRIYAARGAQRHDQARPKLAHLPPPHLMGGIEAATALLAEAIAGDRHIVVVGDFDCDGATACAVAVRGLRMLGARHVSHAVPNRIVHGYGLSPSLVDELAPMAPDLLVTVDHGIACHAGIAAAKARGWQVLVTDHHLPGASLPAADAIVDPNVPGDTFPTRMLAGVGVVFYVLLALRQRISQCHQQPPDLSSLLDLVAVGTVADLVPLDATNRALVAAGLRRIRAGRSCAGLQALIAVAGRDIARFSASDIGFAVAPRLNAAGRLEDMALGIECLLCDDPVRARAMAATLDRINVERRAVQARMTGEAEAVLARLAIDGPVPAALCLFDPDWHPGVVGLVASRMKDRLHRPVIAFAPAAPGSSELRGSARSIPGFHVRDALAAVSARAPGLVPRFGGHAMAAGLSLEQPHFEAFHDAFRQHAADTLDAATLQAELATDGALEPHEFDIATAHALRDGGPWGQAFPEPVFDGEFDVAGFRQVGERHLKLDLAAGHGRLGAIEFGGWNGEAPPPRVRIAFRLEPDDYRGGDAVQLVVVHREPA
ncbi:MAG TPA: single-stranded-DNA-specific exonuclease RecJ [Xanthomonadaceae bacterium]|nr:single-stranded-DNA-specific exonuclease RecJ [Xanthomonadaceae bacterium]